MDTTQPAALARLSISLPAELFAQLDLMVAERGLPSRSQMIAELIRHELAEHSAERPEAVLAGTITLIYRAESGRVRHALAQAQLAAKERKAAEDSLAKARDMGLRLDQIHPIERDAYRKLVVDLTVK